MKRCRSPLDSSSSSHEKKPIQLLLHAPDGIIPYLTPILLNQYVPAPQPHLVLGISVQDTCLTAAYATPSQQTSNDAASATHDNKTTNKKPCGYQFVNQSSPDYLKPYESVLVPSFDLLQDARKNNNNKKNMKPGANQHDHDTIHATDNGVSVWSIHGRQWLSNETYLRIVSESSSSSVAAAAAAAAVSAASASVAVPRAVVSLYDQVVPHRASNQNNHVRRQRRHEQASNRNDEWVQQLLQQQEQQEESMVCSPSIWAAVLLREESLMYVPTEDNRIAGYAIVGWEHCHTSTEQHDRALLIQSLQSREYCTSSPPQNLKTIAVLSVLSMQSILDCLELGVVDVIGTNLPTTWSLAHQAFVLPLEYRKDTHVKRPNRTDTADSSPVDGSGGGDSHSVQLDMTDTAYAKDASPLLRGCTCITCQHYSRAYIHHLYQAKELLAQILLMGHNLHHLLEFCRIATQARNEEDMDAFLQHCNRLVHE